MRDRGRGGALPRFRPGRVAWAARPRAARARFTQLGLAAAAEAVEQAGWGDGPPVEPERAGCVIGTGIGGLQTIEDQHDVLAERGAGAVSPLGIPMLMPNAVAGQVAMAHGLKGECYGTVSACAAGAHAVGAGFRMVAQGAADACVVGGAESAISPLIHGRLRRHGRHLPDGDLATVRRAPRRFRDGGGRGCSRIGGGVGRGRARRPGRWRRCAGTAPRATRST